MMLLAKLSEIDENTLFVQDLEMEYSIDGLDPTTHFLIKFTKVGNKTKYRYSGNQFHQFKLLKGKRTELLYDGLVLEHCQLLDYCRKAIVDAMLKD